MSIYEQLLSERNQLDDIVHKATQFLSQSPKGRMRVQKKDKMYCFYQMGNNLHKYGVYLSKKRDVEVIKSLTSKRYCTAVLKVATKQLEAIDKFLMVYQENSIDDVMSKMHPALQEYITPFKIEDKESCKCTSEATTETVDSSLEVDFAWNLLSTCEAFLKAKGGRP